MQQQSYASPPDRDGGICCGHNGTQWEGVLEKRFARGCGSSEPLLESPSAAFRGQVMGHGRGLGGGPAYPNI